MSFCNSSSVGEAEVEIEVAIEWNLVVRSFETAIRVAKMEEIVRVEVEIGELLKGRVGDEDVVDEIEEDETLILRGERVAGNETVRLGVIEKGEKKGVLGLRRKRD